MTLGSLSADNYNLEIILHHFSYNQTNTNTAH